MRVRLKGINSRTKRLADGTVKTYYWAWKGGPPLPGKPGDPEFIAAYNAAIAQKIEPPSGVLLALLNKFQDSGEFVHNLSERTRRDYVNHITRIERAFADFPIKALDDPKARGVFLEWRDELAKTSLRQADYIYATLARIFVWAMKRGQLAPIHAPGAASSITARALIKFGPTKKSRDFSPSRRRKCAC